MNYVVIFFSTGEEKEATYRNCIVCVSLKLNVKMYKFKMGEK